MIVKLAKSFVSPSDLPASPIHEDDPLSRPNGSWIGPPRRRVPQPGEVAHAPEELQRGEWDPKSDPGFLDDDEPDDDPDDDQIDDVVPGHAAKVKTGGRLDGQPLYFKPVKPPVTRHAAGRIDGARIPLRRLADRKIKIARMWW